MSEAEVLGFTSPPPVAGSPVVTVEALTMYLVIYIVATIGLCLLFHVVKKPLLLSHKIHLVLAVSLILKLLMVVVVLAYLSFLLLPTPKVISTTPKNIDSVKTTSKIEIIFDRPIARTNLQKNITPEVPGVWTFEDPVYATHLYRKVVFNPTVSFAADTIYSVRLSGISNFVKITKPDSYTYSFKTNATPKVTKVMPQNNSRDVEITSLITVNLSHENDGQSEFDFKLTPETRLNVKLSDDKKTYSLFPEIMKQGVAYNLKVYKTDIRKNIPTNTIIERGDADLVYEGNFATKEAPGITRFTPTGGEILPGEEIKITFSRPMDRKSVEENFKITPQVAGLFTWSDDQSVTFKPHDMKYETTYIMKIPKETYSLGGGFIADDIEKSFTTIGKVIAETFYPGNGVNAVSSKNNINITFDQEVDKKSAEEKFSINPPVDGQFSWRRNTLSFTPKDALKFGTTYTVTLLPGVKSVKGLDSAIEFVSTFTTQDETIKLAVPAYLQQYSLSCELAALRMVLDYKGVTLTEDYILEMLGVDRTPKSNGIWGNPHEAFVGNVNGRQMVSGYGVYWEPIARVAKKYRNAKDFRGWNVANLTQAISEKNPVIIWTYSSNGAPTLWNTISGFVVNAVRGEHAVVAVGFVGDKDNPTAIIVNDPLHGQVQWPRAYFDKKWSTFGQSGVVVF